MLGNVYLYLEVIRIIYKQNLIKKSMEKRGQVSIFIILAIVIVAIVVLIFAFPQVNVFASDLNPSSFLRDCVGGEVGKVMNQLNSQGGYLEPDNSVLYKGKNIQYLCYTSENYLPCKVQQPLLVSHYEVEIKDYILPVASQCVSELKTQYEKRGYTVQSSSGDVEVELVPGSVELSFISPFTVTKDSTQSFEKFAVSVNSEIYDLLSIATNIIEFESTLGDSSSEAYLQYYPNLRIDKTKRNGDTIYMLTDVVSGDYFTFASRSLVWPQGYS